MTLSSSVTNPSVDPLNRYEIEARVVAHEHIVGNEFEVVFEAPEIAQAAEPGQFVEMLYNDSYAPLIRRPFSIYRVNRRTGTCSVLYQARGSFTSGLARKRSGDTVGLLGPLGQPFQWRATEAQRHILVAGGIGAPPLYFLASELAGNHGQADCTSDDIMVLNGARTRDLLVGMAEFSALDIRLHALTDDGSHGTAGLVTDLLVNLLDSAPGRRTQLYACGPMPMLRAVGQIAVARDVACQISVETSMPCGIGICNGCAIRVRNAATSNESAYALACIAGPVFEARDLIW